MYLVSHYVLFIIVPEAQQWHRSYKRPSDNIGKRRWCSKL